jgi:hypothetical protein
MTLPITKREMDAMTTERKLSITLDADGLWRRKRFEFCNALEEAIDRGDEMALELLKQMGVRPSDTAQTDTRKP